ncbi:hypothetical protein ACXX82_01965 [Glaciimonas sp. GNP009]
MQKNAPLRHNLKSKSREKTDQRQNMRSHVTGKIISFALALGVVSALFWVMSTSINLPQKDKPQPSPQTTDTPSKASLAPNNPPNREPNQTIQSDQQNQIYKCRTNNRASYSDQKCGDTQRTTTVNIHETSGGFISPDPHTIADTRAKIRTEMQQPGATAIVSDSTTNNPPYECTYLAAEINAIDAASRERHTGQEQQRLRLRREEVRTREFRLGC